VQEIGALKALRHPKTQASKNQTKKIKTIKVSRAVPDGQPRAPVPTWIELRNFPYQTEPLATGVASGREKRGEGVFMLERERVERARARELLRKTNSAKNRDRFPQALKRRSVGAADGTSEEFKESSLRHPQFDLSR